MWPVNEGVVCIQLTVAPIWSGYEAISEHFISMLVWLRLGFMKVGQ